MSKSKFEIHLEDQQDYRENPALEAMAVIVDTLGGLYALALKDKSTHFYLMHPRVLLSTLVTNIMLNFFLNMVPVEKNPINVRLEMAHDLMKEINTIFLDCVQKMETLRDDTKEEPH